MQSFESNADVLREAAFVLARTSAFAAQHEGNKPLHQAAMVAASVLLELLRAKASDSGLLRTVLEALAEFLESSQGLQSSLRNRICEALSGNTGVDGPSGGLLSEVSAEHESNTALQGVVMWVAGLTSGVAAVVREMHRNPRSFTVQVAAVRALATIYTQQLDHEASDINTVARGACIQAVMTAMSNFPENLVMWASSCYALSSIVQHGVDTVVTEELLLPCVQASTKALTLAQSQENEWNMNLQASYLREEAVRLVATVCCASPKVGDWLRQNPEALEAKLGQAMETAVTLLAKDKEGKFSEEALVHNLLALVNVVGPEAAVVKTLRQWGARPMLVRACSDTVAETMRRQHPRICEEMLRGPVRAELESAAKAHVENAPLQGSVQLALGFLGS